MVSVQSSESLTALLVFQLRVSSCHDVRVTARLWLRFSYWWFCRESDWTGLVLEPELEIGLSVRKCVKAG